MKSFCEAVAKLSAASKRQSCFGTTIHFFALAPKFCHWPVCSPRRTTVVFVKKSLPPPSVGAPSASNSPSPLSAQAG